MWFDYNHGMHPGSRSARQIGASESHALRADSGEKSSELAVLLPAHSFHACSELMRLDLLYRHDSLQKCFVHREAVLSRLSVQCAPSFRQ